MKYTRFADIPKYTRFADIPEFVRGGSYEVNCRLYDLPRVIKQYQEEDGLQLCPDFQRGHVWKRAQQIAYMEFFLRGGRTGGTFYLNQPGWPSGPGDQAYQDFVVVDGLQRITAALRFMNNEIPVFRSYFKDYEDDVRHIHADFRININALWTRTEVLQWYLEMNSGGTPHSKSELERVQALLAEEKK